MDGDIVAIAMQNCWGGTSASLTALDDKIQSLVGATSPELRLENLGKCDAYAFVFQKGRNLLMIILDLINVVLLFYLHGKHLRSCRNGQLT